MSEQHDPFPQDDPSGFWVDVCAWVIFTVMASGLLLGVLRVWGLV